MPQKNNRNNFSARNDIQYNKPPVGVRQERTFAFEARNVDDEKRTVEVSFSSEQPVHRFWGDEILCHDDDCVDLTRLKALGVSLFNHNVDVVIGVPQNPVLNAQEKRCHADIFFDDDADSDKIFQKVKKGILRGVSVGYQVDEWEEVPAGKKSTNGRFTGPCYVATKWTPLEVSIVSVPADSDVGVNRSINDYTNNNVQSTGRNLNMELQALCRSLGLDYEELQKQGFTDEQIRTICSAIQKRSTAGIQTRGKKAAEDGSEDDSEDDDETDDDNAEPDDEETKGKGKKSAKKISTRKAVEAYRREAIEIAKMCKDFGEDPIPYIEEGRSVAQVNAAILEKVKNKREAVSGNNSFMVTAAQEDKIRSAATDGILIRGGLKIVKPAEGANDYRGMSLRDLAIDCLERAGVSNARKMDSDELYKRAVTPDSQFASILSNAVNKSMATAYNAAPPTYQAWTGEGSNPDFKNATHYQISEAGDLKQVSQSGELKFDEMKDNGVSKKVLTFGRSFGFTRQAMINDDLGVLTKIPQAYVRAAGRGVNKMVYAILAGNSTIYDNKALFCAAHNNLAGTAAAITTDSISDGRTAMKKQRNQRGKEVLNIAPAFLIVPAQQETKAAQLLRSVSDPSQANPNVVNILANSMTLVSDAELDDYSKTAWYMAANPGDIDTIEVTYLNGNKQPILESQVGFDFVGIKWRILHDVGVTALDYRGLYMNAGA